MMSILFLLVGLGLILSGANFLTDGAAALAKRFNISSLVIGLTIVAFGTSAPELTVSIVSAINGSAELSIGNVVLRTVSLIRKRNAAQTISESGSK